MAGGGRVFLVPPGVGFLDDIAGGSVVPYGLPAMTGVLVAARYTLLTRLVRGGKPLSHPFQDDIDMFARLTLDVSCTFMGGERPHTKTHSVDQAYRAYTRVQHDGPLLNPMDYLL